MSARRADPRRYWLGVLVAAALVATAIGCGGAEPPADRGPIVRPIRMHVVGEDSVGRLTFPGRVQAVDRAEISFRVSGEINQLPVNEGDSLRRGQLVAQLDKRDFEIDVQEALAIFQQAQAERDRFQRLYESEAVPLADLELRIAQADVAESRLEQARTNLGYTTLVAPFPGWVGRRNKQNFERANAQEPVITLHDIDRLELVIDVPESLIAQLRDGGQDLNLAARFSAAGDLEFPLSLNDIAAEADPQTRTFQVTLGMRQPRELNVLPGMTGTVIARPGADADASIVTVPAVAVMADNSGDSFVWLVDQASMRVRRRPVRVGQVIGASEIEVLEGLALGETVAVTAVHVLEEGMEVTRFRGPGE